MAYTAVHTVWVLACHPEDRWLVHCLDVDHIADGETLAEALAKVVQTTALFIRSMTLGREDPYGHRAPDAYWNDRDVVLRKGDLVVSPDLRELGGHALAFEVKVEVDYGPRLVAVHGEDPPEVQVPKIGLVWEWKAPLPVERKALLTYLRGPA